MQYAVHMTQTTLDPEESANTLYTSLAAGDKNVWCVSDPTCGGAQVIPHPSWSAPKSKRWAKYVWTYFTSSEPHHDIPFIIHLFSCHGADHVAMVMRIEVSGFLFVIVCLWLCICVFVAVCL